MFTNTWGSLGRSNESMAEKACKCINSITNAYSKGPDKQISDFFDYNQQSIDLETYSSKEQSDQEKFLKESIIFIDPNQANQRIIMQQGLFMFPYTLDEDKHSEIIAKNTKCIMIHKTHRNKVLEYLDILGFNSFKLMPDLGSICDAIKQKYKR